MSENGGYIGLDAAGVKRVMADLEQADEVIGEVRDGVTEVRSEYENPPVYGNEGDKIAKGFADQYQPLADRLMSILDQYHAMLTGPNGVPSLLSDAVDKFGQVEQASADGFNAAARPLEA
jgi:hypothetical protein